MTNTNNKEILGTIPLGSFGVNLVITKENGAYDHASIRVAQLDALTSILSGDGFAVFELYTESVKDNVMWLVHELAHEIKHLLPIVSAEAVARGASMKEKTLVDSKSKKTSHE